MISLYDRMSASESEMAFTAANSLAKYKEWAADKTTKYKHRLEYDKWAAREEARIILAATRIEAWKRIGE